MKKKHSLILALLITEIVSLLSVHRHETILAWSHTKYVSIKKIDTGKSDTQNFVYFSLQVAEIFMTSYFIKPIKSAGNFQTKIIQDIWTKVSEFAFKCHSSFDRKSIAALRF